jgi:hypothetical protein
MNLEPHVSEISVERLLGVQYVLIDGEADN